MKVVGRGFHLIFKDSLNFFSRALSQLPTMFGLRDSKGYFPHRLNIMSNMGRILYPQAADYEPDRKSSAERQTFFSWWANNAGKPLDVSSELVRYCRQDVKVLREACCAYRKAIQQSTDIDPFLKPSTQARLSLDIYLRRHMPKSTILNMPEIGLRTHDRQSVLALRYFRTLELLNPDIMVQDASWSIGEARFGNRQRVDGVVSTLFIICKKRFLGQGKIDWQRFESDRICR
jgi:hypothetical protein